ncbi:hypothetical protein [Acrocarpospora corrugata]|nr:hypothetical protein [Acrocarpospora corrugata]
MNTFATRKRAVGMATLAALTTLTAIAAMTAPARAASGRCVLTITADAYSPGFWRANNNCAPASPSDKLVQSVYWGADWPDVDDYLNIDFRYPTMNHTFTTVGAYFDEDFTGSDEVYTENRFVRPNGSRYTVKSNEVHKRF